MNEVEKKVEGAIKNLESSHGLLVRRLGDKTIVARERMPSGSTGLDKVLGGGWVVGSLNEIFGPESSGKSTVCLHSMAEAQKRGLVLLVDNEHSFDPFYARNLGVDVDNLYVCQPSFAEQTFDVIEHLVSTGEFSMIVLDSIAGLSPRAEAEGDPGDSNMGVAARLNRQHLRKMTSLAANNKCTILYTNQITYKIGVMFGNPETTTGGTGFKFFCSTRIDIRKISTQKDSIKAGGIRCRVKGVKNKTHIPYLEAEFEIEFGEGVNVAEELLQLGLTSGKIEKSGAWYSIGSDRMGQGKISAVQFIKDNMSMFESRLGVVDVKDSD